MINRKQTVFLAAALCLASYGVYDVVSPQTDPVKISDDVSSIIAYMDDVESWTLDGSARWAFHPKSHIAVYASRFSDVAEIRIGVSDGEHTYSGISVPLSGQDGRAFSQASLKLMEQLVIKRRPALTDYIGRLKNGGS